MKFDFAKTLALVKGGLFDHETTWKAYFEDCPGWQQTALVLTGPLLVASVLLSAIFSRLFGTFSQYALYGNFFTGLIYGLLMAAVTVLIVSFVISMMAKVFEGKSDFSRAFAAVSFAVIPAWIAAVLGSVIPWVGWLVTLAGGITSLVFLYKIIPLALEVPDNKRVVHFIVSLVITFVINMVIGVVIGTGSGVNQAQMGAFSKSGSSNSRGTVPGVVSEFERQGKLMEAADSDVFNPPSNGQVREGQVKDYLKVKQKTRVLQEEYAAKMKKISDDMDAKQKAGKSPSISDLTSMYKGIGSAVSVVNLEMEVVKTGGGNWAEHQWVKEQLRVAYIQQGEGSDAIEHNYKLYKKYEDDLDI